MKTFQRGSLVPYRTVLLFICSAALHLFLIIPFGIARLITPTEKDQTPVPEELVFIMPDENIKAQPDKQEEPKQQPLPQESNPKMVLRPPKPETKPEEKPPQVKEERPKERAKIPVIEAHKKMVEQEHFPDENDNVDAQFLAAKNHRTKKQTQAKNSNLEKHSKPQGRPPLHKPFQQEQPAPNKQLTERHQLVQAAQKKPTRMSPGRNISQSILSMGPETSLHHEQTNEQPVKPGAETPSKSRSKQTNSLAHPKNMNSLLSGPFLPAGPLLPSAATYKKILGEENLAAQQKAVLEAKPSAEPGRFETFVEETNAFRSAIENFTPGIEVGTENELGTRAHPFASYIANIHRRIHKRWALSFLAGLSQGSDQDFPSDTQASILIVLNEDGTLCKHSLTKVSGYARFDMAAFSAVSRAGPFPAPPEALRSPNGKVYITWSFFRDNRQCATDFTNAHVINKETETCTDTKAKPLSKEQSDNENSGTNEIGPSGPGGFRF